MPFFAGRSSSLTLSRRLVTDYMHLSRKIPLVAMERRMDLCALIAARAQAVERPSWYALLAKAFALVAMRHPVLRSVYLPYPWPRVYEHPESVAAVVVEREVEGVSTPLIADLPGPERRSLAELSARVRCCQSQPLYENDAFRRALRIARLPLPLRRYLLWWPNEWWGTLSHQFFGTFGISLTASLGATLIEMRTPWTTVLHAGPFTADGQAPVRVWFDHRLLDGASDGAHPPRFRGRVDRGHHSRSALPSGAGGGVTWGRGHQRDRPRGCNDLRDRNQRSVSAAVSIRGRVA